MTKSITICALVGLICLFTEVVRGQQASAVQPLAPAMITESSQHSAAEPSESDVAKANNAIAPMNAIYFQNYYAPTVRNVLAVGPMVVAPTRDEPLPRARQMASRAGGSWDSLAVGRQLN
jgi:hypothetical protein